MHTYLHYYILRFDESGQRRPYHISSSQALPWIKVTVALQRLHVLVHVSVAGVISQHDPPDREESKVHTSPDSTCHCQGRSLSSLCSQWSRCQWTGRECSRPWCPRCPCRSCTSSRSWTTWTSAGPQVWWASTPRYSRDCRNPRHTQTSALACSSGSASRLWSEAASGATTHAWGCEVRTNKNISLPSQNWRSRCLYRKPPLFHLQWSSWGRSWSGDCWPESRWRIQSFPREQSLPGPASPSWPSRQRSWWWRRAPCRRWWRNSPRQGRSGQKITFTGRPDPQCFSPDTPRPRSSTSCPACTRTCRCLPARWGWCCRWGSCLRRIWEN